MKKTTFRVYARKVENQKFYNYSYFSEKTGKFYQISFTQDGKNQPKPKNDGYFLLTVDQETLSIKKNQKRTYQDKVTGENKTVLLNDTIWIGDVIDWKEDVEYLEQRKQEMAAELEEIF